MYILHIASHYGVYSRIALAQKKRGHDISIIANLAHKQSDIKIKKNLATWKKLIEAGIPVRQIRYESLRGLFHLRQIFKIENFDIIHVHRNQALLATWLALFRMKRPRLIAQRGTITPPPLFHRLAFRSRHVRAIIAVSGAVKTALTKYNINEQKIHVVYGSVDIEEFTPRTQMSTLKDKLDIPLNSRVIGSLSAYRKAKGFYYLMPALAKIMQENHNVHAVFLGKSVAEKLAPLAKELDIHTHCHFVGHQTNVAEWLSIMDFTVIAATDREGLSGVLRESLAMEVPVISTACAGNNEIVVDKKTGLLVPANDVDALIKAMMWALANGKTMKEMARRGREWVANNCSQEYQANQILDIYQHVLDMNRFGSKGK
jgi:glycosyltransferase involved in cell wall biosynthesis